MVCVATVPGNHSGSHKENKCDLKSDNEWRKKFGFSKAWLNNGNWYEPDHIGMRCKDITELVTHWGYLPEVPELTEIFTYTDKRIFNQKETNEEWIKIAQKTHNENDHNEFSFDDYIKGYFLIYLN